jgi:hypothetical protein
VAGMSSDFQQPEWRKLDNHTVVQLAGEDCAILYCRTETLHETLECNVSVTLYKERFRDLPSVHIVCLAVEQCVLDSHCVPYLSGH